MKKLWLIGFLIPQLLQGQRLHINLFGGISNYNGDLQGKAFTLDQSNASFGLGVQYDITHNFSVLSNLNYLNVGASDKYNKPDLQARNLSFQTQIYEWNVLGEYNLFDLTERRWSPYVFAGLGIFHFDPYAFDTAGNKVYLHPLNTEGQGLPQYPGQRPYNLTQVAIPFGGGIKLRIADNITIAYEINVRKLFTDYLDDVSTVYVDSAILAAARGPLAVEMAYRGGELKGGSPYPPTGTIRGDPKHKDWYYFTGIRISIGLNTKDDLKYGKRGSVACPKLP